MIATVIIGLGHRYVGNGARKRPCSRRQRPSRRTTMRNNLLALLGAVAIAAAAAQIAVAGERQHVRKPVRAPSATTEQLRNANAAWAVQPRQPDIYRYSGGWSAPAGR
jgi:hypothetical protein